MSRILNIILVQAKNDEERSAIMAKGNMTIRMEPELKAQAAALFKSLGMDLSTATGIFYRQALRCHGLPFEVKVDEPNAVTYAAMEAAEKGEDMYGPFDMSNGNRCSKTTIILPEINIKSSIQTQKQTNLEKRVRKNKIKYVSL